MIEFFELGPAVKLVQCSECHAAIPEGNQMSHKQWHQALSIKNMFGGLF